MKNLARKFTLSKSHVLPSVADQQVTLFVVGLNLWCHEVWSVWFVLCYTSDVCVLRCVHHIISAEVGRDSDA